MVKPVHLILSLATTATVLLSSIGPSFAADSTQSSTATESPWSFRFAPYAWGTALKGTAGVNGVDADVDLSIKDVLDRVDGGAMAAFEVKYDRWSSTTDLVYAKLSDSSPTPKGIVFSEADYDIKQLLWTQTLGYTVVKEDCFSIDLLAGFRLASVDQDLDLEGAVLPNGTAVQDRSPSRDDTWIDPIIGVRGRAALGEDFFIMGMGDIGGFNASSALTWQAMGVIGYQLCDYASVGIGYRGLGYDHNRDGFKYNMDMHGPILGIETSF